MVKVEIARRRCMQMSVHISSTGNGCRVGASCVLAAVGRSAEAGADCGTISSAGLGFAIACVPPASAAADCSLSGQSSFQQRAGR